MSATIITKLKYLAVIVAGQSPPSEAVSDIAEGQPFLQGNAEFGLKYPTAKYECGLATKLAQVGDVLVSVRAPVGALNMADREYGIGRGLCTIRPSVGPANFYYWWLHDRRDELDSLATGSTFVAVTTGTLGDLRVPISDPDEQLAIAEYLDQETAEIDGFIADQEALIWLLNERRAATITQAVTKGIDPTVPIKDSGLEWLGTVPNHWDVGRTKHVGTIVLGKMLQPAAKGSDDIERTYLRAANVQPLGRLALSSKKSMWFSRAELARLTLRAGDVVIVEGGVGGFGRAAYVDQDLSGWAFQNSIIRIRPASSFDGRFVNYAFLHLREVEYIHMAASVTSMPHFTAEKVEGTLIGWPEYDEQREIADYLDRETEEIDAAIEDAKQAIVLSKERRTALISAAVTGKIDVRDHVRAGAEGAA